MQSLQHFSVNDSIEPIGLALERDGAVIVEGILSPAVLDQLNREIDPLLEHADPARSHVNPVVAAFFGDRVRHLTGMAGKSYVFAEQVMCHPLYMALCDRVLLPNCADYRLNLAHLMERGPGAQAQFPHRDHDLWWHFPRPRPELMLASVVALMDFTRANGATFLAPGSHRWPNDRVATEHDYVYAEMPAGAAVIYFGSTIHGGGTNSTRDQWRRGFHMSYALGWLRTEENNALAVAPERAKNLSRRARQLVGYGVHDAINDGGGYLGMVNLSDPGELLDKGLL